MSERGAVNKYKRTQQCFESGISELGVREGGGGFWLRFLFQRGNRLFHRTTRTTPDGLKGIFIDRKVHNKSNTKIRISSTNVNLSLKHYDTNVAHKNTRNWTIRIKVKQVVLLTSSPLITWMFRFQWAAASSRSPWRGPHWKYEQLTENTSRTNATGWNRLK